MRALCVDDEPIPLRALAKAVEGASGISEVAAFEDEADALAWVADHPVDVAFLDIELHAMNGLDVARALRRICPDVAVVFCTSFERYALEAIRLHIDAGYLMKPLRPQRVQEEVDHILARRGPAERRLTVTCFGDFEAFADGRPLEFRRRRAKELFAYLVDRRGAQVSSAQACAVLWGDEAIDGRKRDMLYHLASALRQTLDECGHGEALISRSGGYAVDVRALDCDYYRLLDGDESARRRYTGEYMSQYSWAEPTNAWLATRLSKITKGGCPRLR